MTLVSGFWSMYFAWYSGAVYSNLLASLIWGTPVGLLAAWHLAKRERARRQHHEQTLAAHHDSVSDLITTLTAEVRGYRAAAEALLREANARAGRRPGQEGTTS